MAPIYRFVILLLAFLVQNVINQELTAEVLSVKLPEKMVYTSSVYDGEDAFYIIGGKAEDDTDRSDIYKYSLADQTLTQEGSLPYPRRSGSAVFDDKKENIYYLGGYNGTARSEVYKFNLATNLITEVDNLTTPSYDHAAIKYKNVNSKVFLIGGAAPNGKIIHCWDMDLQSNCATQTIDTNFYDAAAVSYGNEAFVFGNGNLTSRVDPVYKINLDTFQTSFGEQTLPNFLGSSVAVVSGSKAWITGGWENQTNFPVNSIIQIDLVSLAQTVLTVKNFNQNERYIYGSSAVYVERLNRIYVVGGRSNPSEYHDEIWSIDLDPVSISPTTTGPTSPSLLTSTTLP